LLRANYFSRWPLQLRFFTEDVYQKWRAYSDKAVPQISPEVKILLDFQNVVAQQQKGDHTDLGAALARVRHVDPSYAPLKDFLEKSRTVLDPSEGHECSVCRETLDIEQDLIAICSKGKCLSTSHITCLSDLFLKETGQEESLLPSGGKCPECKSRLDWPTLMKEATLRLRGQKQIGDILKKGRKKRRVTTVAEIAAELDDNANDELDDEDDKLTAANIAEVDGDLIEEEDEDDATSVTSAGSRKSYASSLASARRSTSRRPERVIEDSEWDEVEILE